MHSKVTLVKGINYLLPKNKAQKPAAMDGCFGIINMLQLAYDLFIKQTCPGPLLTVHLIEISVTVY